MPPVVLELGELEHIHISQNLKLRTNVALSLSQVSHISTIDSAELETLISTGTRIAGGNRLQIHVQFNFDDIEFSDCGNASIVEEIGVRFSNAEIWRQLGLDATYNLSGVDAERSDPPNELVLNLSGQTTSHTTANAPTSVPSACLESVRLLFNFSTCRRIRIPSNINGHSTVLSKEAARQVALHSYDADALGIPWGPPRAEQQRPHIDTNFHGQEPNQAIGSPNERQEIPQTVIQSSPSAMSPPNSHGSVSSMPLRSGRDSSYSSSPGSKHATQKINFESLFKIMNASLRLMICDREAPRREGVILSKDTGFPRLTEILPTVFSPHFLEAVSRRSGLPPNIAHTMCGVYRRTRSGSLKRKLERLLETFPNGSLAHDANRFDESESNRAALPAAIQAHLWCLMQHKLLDSQAWARRKFEILSGPQTTCELDVGSHMLDDQSIGQNTATVLDDETNHLLLDSQYMSMAVEFGVGGHTLDEPEGVGVHYSDSDHFTDRYTPIADKAEGEDLYWPEWKTVSVDQSKEDGLFYGQTDTLEADDDMDEDLFWGVRDMEGPHHDTHDDMINDIPSAGQDDFHYIQGSSEGFARCESPNSCEEDHEEMLDSEEDILKENQVCSRGCENCVQRGPWSERHEEVLGDGHNILDVGLAQCLAREEDHQELLDARQEICDPDQAFLEGFALCTHAQVDHEEILDDASNIRHGSQASGEGLFPYTSWEQGHQDKTKIFSDPQTATILDAGFAEHFPEQNGNEGLDGERMVLDADQWNRALIMV